MSHRPWKYGVVLLSTAALAITGASVAAAASTSPKAAPTAALAPALDGSSSGGAVIVILKNQHANLNLRTQGTSRRAAAFADQKSLLSDIKASGGTDITQLVSVNGIAATVSADEVTRLRANPAVAKVVPDSTVSVPAAAVTPAQAPPADLSPALCPTDPSKPLIEPEALTDIHAYSADPADKDEANRIATGKGVIVANDGVDQLSGNPNFVRPDGTSVIIDSATPTADNSDGEYYGDVSSIAGQGQVVYDFSKELPFSGLPTGCTFVIRGDAPDASLVDTNHIDTPPSAAGDPATETEAQVVAGIDNAVIVEHADIINESYGYSNRPGSYATHYAANDAAVAAGVTVVVSSGDSGAQGTASSPATDPLVIEAGATNTLRLNAQAYGYTKWTNDNITPLSSGGTSPNNKVPDLVAPGYGGEAACSPTGSDCPTNTLTEAFGGTSEAAPIIAGAAADVIQAYRDTHGGTSPSPAQVKQILVGSATDVDSPADEQGAGLVNIYAAVRAAQQMPGSTLLGTTNNHAVLVPDQGQLDVTGAGGTTDNTSVTLYNASSKAATVHANFRALKPYKQIGSTVTEPVSAPNPALPVPAEGAPAAAPITFTVPAGTDRLQTSMIWPDATNGTILSYDLIDPNGALTQISYDYGTPSTRGPTFLGSVPDIGNTEVADPVPGTWTAIIRWANGRSHLQEPPNVPGSYTGNVSFRVMGAKYGTTSAATGVTIPADSSASVPLAIAFPAAAGDAPESVQFVGSNGSAFSLPIARRTLIPTSAANNKFTTTITGSVGRGIGQISTFNVDVPAGENDMTIKFSTPDASADNPMTFWLLNPSGVVVAEDRTPTTTLQGVGSTVPTALAALVVTAPAAGRWEVDVELNLTTSGNEFTQAVAGTLGFNLSKVKVLSGLPTVSTTVIKPSVPRNVSLSVTNTSGVGRSFTLTSPVAGDLVGGAATTPVYIAAGASVLVTTTIVPKAAAGTVVTGTLNVVSNSSLGGSSSAGKHTFASFPYTYTVGTP